MSNLAGEFRKDEKVYPTGASGPNSKFLVECFRFFVHVIQATSQSLLCVSVSLSGHLTLDYILLISAQILVPLITPQLSLDRLIPTARPERSEYFLAGLNDGGASIELSKKKLSFLYSHVIISCTYKHWMEQTFHLRNDCFFFSL